MWQLVESGNCSLWWIEQQQGVLIEAGITVVIDHEDGYSEYGREEGRKAGGTKMNLERTW